MIFKIVHVRETSQFRYGPESKNSTSCSVEKRSCMAHEPIAELDAKIIYSLFSSLL